MPASAPVPASAGPASAHPPAPARAASRPSYLHLARLTDDVGLFEHSRYAEPRPEHGYCVDDVARGLVVAVREPEPTPELTALAETYLRFLEGALEPDGRMHNRRALDGSWPDEADVGDWWGRAVQAFGTAAVHAPDAFTRHRALRDLHRAAQQRTPHLRAAAHAVLGAGEVLLAEPGDRAALDLVTDLAPVIDAHPHHAWPWPEERLAYGNAVVAEAVLLAGHVLRRPALIGRGLALLRFLLDTETTEDRLSVTGHRGRAPGEAGPLFDQQPIEVGAIADACARAADLTGDPGWASGVDLAFAWFLGRNDAAVPMLDADTGAGYDGLHRRGRNENRGAESTLAALATWQHARRLHAGSSGVATDDRDRTAGPRHPGDADGAVRA